MAWFKRFVTGILLLSFTLIIACGNGTNMKSPEIPTPSPTPDVRSYLEKRAEDIGVLKLPNGHLQTWGKAPIVFLRLLAYWNAESSAEGENGTFYPRKVAGAYEVVPLPRGTRVHYEIHFSDDDFGKLPDLAPCSKKENAASPYEKLDTVLECLNASAAASGKEYKVKAWYERKEEGGTLASDTLYAMIQFSFDMPRDKISPQTAIFSRSYFLLEAKQNAIIARTAIELAQVLENGEELAIVALDFVGLIPNEPEFVYIFDRNAIAHLQGFNVNNAEQEWREILSLSEVQDRVSKSEDPGSIEAERTKEPISDKEIEIVARIAQETSRILKPTLGIVITIYDFKGRAPKDLTTWIYTFDGTAAKTIRSKELTPKEILAQAKVVEQRGELIDGRVIPPVKPILREAGK